MTTKKEAPDHIIPIPAGYVALSGDPTGRSNQVRRPIIGVAKHSSGTLLACVLDEEGRPQFREGPVHVEGEPAGERAVKALQELASTVKVIQSAVSQLITQKK